MLGSNCLTLESLAKTRNKTPEGRVSDKAASVIRSRTRLWERDLRNFLGQPSAKIREMFPRIVCAKYSPKQLLFVNCLNAIAYQRTQVKKTGYETCVSSVQRDGHR